MREHERIKRKKNEKPTSDNSLQRIETEKNRRKWKVLAHFFCNESSLILLKLMDLQTHNSCMDPYIMHLPSMLVGFKLKGISLSHHSPSVKQVYAERFSRVSRRFLKSQKFNSRINTKKSKQLVFKESDCFNWL